MRASSSRPIWSTPGMHCISIGVAGASNASSRMPRPVASTSCAKYPRHRSGQTLDPPRHRHPRRDVGTPLRDPGDGAQANPPEERTNVSRSPGSEPNSMLFGGGSSTTRMTHSWHGKRPSRKDRSNQPKSSESCTVVWQQQMSASSLISWPNLQLRAHYPKSMRFHFLNL